MSKVGRPRNERLITDPNEIWKIKQRYPRARMKPLCNVCKNPVKKLTIDQGYGSKPRRKHIGWYCEKDNLLFYLNGTADLDARFND